MPKRNELTGRIGRFEGLVGKKANGDAVNLSIVISPGKQVYRTYNPQKRIASGPSDAFRVVYGKTMAGVTVDQLVERGTTIDVLVKDPTTIEIAHKAPQNDKTEPVHGLYDLVSSRTSSPAGHFRLKNMNPQVVVDFRFGTASDDSATYRFLNSGDNEFTVTVGNQSGTATSIAIGSKQSRDVTVTGRQKIAVTATAAPVKGIYELLDLNIK